jgi:hypothetical protein
LMSPLLVDLPCPQLAEQQRRVSHAAPRGPSCLPPSSWSVASEHKFLKYAFGLHHRTCSAYRETHPIARRLEHPSLWEAFGCPKSYTKQWISRMTDWQHPAMRSIHLKITELFDTKKYSRRCGTYSHEVEAPFHIILQFLYVLWRQ